MCNTNRVPQSMITLASLYGSNAAPLNQSNTDGNVQQQKQQQGYQNTMSGCYQPAASRSANFDNMTVCTPDILKLVSANDDAPKMQFPWILHQLIDETDDSIVSWNADGTSFKIHDRDTFMQVAPTFFKFKKFRSFTRQLNMWNFTYFSTGPNKGEYQHPKFIRNMKWLCRDMKREKSRKSPSSSAAAAAKKKSPSANGGGSSNSNSNSNILSSTSSHGPVHGHVDVTAPSPLAMGNQPLTQMINYDAFGMTSAQQQQQHSSDTNAFHHNTVAPVKLDNVAAPPAFMAQGYDQGAATAAAMVQHDSFNYNVDPNFCNEYRNRFGTNNNNSSSSSSNNSGCYGNNSSNSNNGQAATDDSHLESSEDRMFAALFKHLETRPLNDFNNSQQQQQWKSEHQQQQQLLRNLVDQIRSDGL